jgi:hypothetical protein
VFSQLFSSVTCYLLFCRLDYKHVIMFVLLGYNTVQPIVLFDGENAGFSVLHVSNYCRAFLHKSFFEVLDVCSMILLLLPSLPLLPCTMARYTMFPIRASFSLMWPVS